ncbi:DUF2156 domain-containing protein [Candidatus Nomurabacteria bacterium]|nr:DUF2156 domain-containing protein [Candidatus Nomurabacteria bacterium]
MSNLEFTKPDEALRRRLEFLNQDFIPYADTMPGTLIAWWNLYNDLEYAPIGSSGIVIRSSYLQSGNRVVYTYLGDPGQASQDIQSIFEYEQSINQERVVYSVPKYSIEQIRNDFDCENDVDISEYVIDIPLFSELASKDYKKIRRKINKIRLEYPSLYTKDLVSISHTEREEISNFIKKIPVENDIDDDENRVMLESLDKLDMYDLKVSCIYNDDEIVAVCMYKNAPHGHVNINHIRADHKYPHSFLYALHELAIKLGKEGFSHMNIEQDLGLEGLRTFKSRLHPSMMLEKYTVRPRKDP